MSIVWNNSLGEIGAKQSEYEKAAPSQYLHLGYYADEEMRDGAVGKFGNVSYCLDLLLAEIARFFQFWPLPRLFFVHLPRLYALFICWPRP